MQQYIAGSERNVPGTQAVPVMLIHVPVQYYGKYTSLGV